MLNWFVEYYAPDFGSWTFADGTVPLVRQRDSKLVYSGASESVHRILLELPAKGLPSDISPIPLACAQLALGRSRAHSWLSADELIELSSSDARLCSVIESIVYIDGSRVIFWFEDE